MGRIRVSPDGHEVSALVDALPGGRCVLGLTGAPGAGKSTLAAALASAYGVPVVPMDGFHRRQAELVAMGRADAKGAPDTFDAEAYAAVLRRLNAGGPVRAPSFDHAQSDPVPDTIEVPCEAGLVVTEGNYLLLDEPRWHAVALECDAIWYLVCDDAVRIERLVTRHVAAGKSPREAEEWVARVDEVNTALIEAAAGGADEVLDLTLWAGSVRTGRQAG
jgi:pantothenate kinase